MRVLIIPDKFKGTLTAAEAAEAIALGWRKGRPDDAIELLPMSDGGDGFGPVFGAMLAAEARTVATVDAAQQSRDAMWWFQKAERVAVVETVQSIGLALLPPGKFHPFELDTFGLGALFRAASKAGAKICYAGIGGSATNDGGFGMARALGWRFQDRPGDPITRWTDLINLERVTAPAQIALFEELIIAVDVQNPFLGPQGASRIYGPQKGLRAEDMERAEAALGKLAAVMHEQFGTDSEELGTGAAGGLGFGLRAFLNGRFESGFELFARLAKLDQRFDNADIVITAEGSIDQSTLMGKGVGELALRCAGRNLPCIGLAGNLAVSAPAPFSRVHGIYPQLTNLENAKSAPAHWLSQLAEMASRG